MEKKTAGQTRTRWINYSTLKIYCMESLDFRPSEMMGVMEDREVGRRNLEQLSS